MSNLPRYRMETIDLDARKRSWQTTSIECLSPGDIVPEWGKVESVTESVVDRDEVVTIEFISSRTMTMRRGAGVYAFTF